MAAGDFTAELIEWSKAIQERRFHDGNMEVCSCPRSQF